MAAACCKPVTKQPPVSRRHRCIGASVRKTREQATIDHQRRQTRPRRRRCASHEDGRRAEGHRLQATRILLKQGQYAHGGPPKPERSHAREELVESPFVRQTKAKAKAKEFSQLDLEVIVCNSVLNQQLLLFGVLPEATK